MSRTWNPHAMQPHGPARTRSAPPRIPDRFWSLPRMRRYLLFDATGFVYLLVGFLILRAAWALGDGAEAWGRVLQDYRSPLYLLFHAITLVAVIFVGVRFFGLFPKAQPPRIGPAKPPPRPVIHAMLYAVWGVVTLALLLVLGGVIL
jgi:fumarate reductase subunit C